MDLNNIILNLTFMLFLWIAISSSCSAFPITKEGCQDHCGNVSIPYPFGTKEDCYFREEFFINCNNSVNLFLGNSSVKVTSISMEEGQLRVLYPIGYLQCDPKSNTTLDEFEQNMLLPGTLTFSSVRNKFTVIGCDTYAFVSGRTHEHAYTIGCPSICDSQSDVFGGCYGSGCSQISIPNGTSQINISVNSVGNCSDYVLDFSPYNYAFMVEESQFNFFPENLTNIEKDYKFPVVIDWVVEKVTCKEAKKIPSSYACVDKNSECVDVKSLGHRCRCKTGYEDNPYLAYNGCKHINECTSLKHIDCVDHSTCNNTPGSYNCDCDLGYRQTSETLGINECIPDIVSKKKFNFWAPIYAAIGICVIVIVISYFLYSKLLTMKEDSLREEYFKKNGGFLLREKLNASARDANSYSIRIFNVEELQKATNDFDDRNIIGQGGFGTVYKGELIDETIVAIKKSKGIDQRGVEQFINEVIFLSQINNRNVVKLFGCCLETEVPLLVYEFINNGTLLEHLKGMIRNRASNLSWNIRVRIASQVAGVLFYLHSCASTQIIHRDIKSSNILLDQDYMAKVADFGISKLISMDENQLSTMVQGTPGYLDPEYMQTGSLTEKSDVYSFGVVLIELLTAKKVFSADRPEIERFLANYFLHQLNNDNLLGILDHNMVYNNEVFEQIKEVAMIAKRCISVKGEDRPCMKEALRDLETFEIQGSNIVERDSENQCEVFDDKQHSVACTSSDGHPRTFASCDLSQITTSTVESTYFQCLT